MTIVECPLDFPVMAKRTSESRAVTYRVKEPTLERLDRFLDQWEQVHRFRMTATQFVESAIVRMLDEEEPRIAGKPKHKK